jgi:2-succinyl-5-enolpyruvyl-6-hydroxy-3-cyclohexene-1-carboxylate synthase
VTANQALAVAAVDRLLAAGVRTFAVCPGGRNAPLVEAIEALPPGGAEALSFFDERSAGFFALGRARRDRSPVAVVTTSGTAAAELLPAMVEAHYSSTPVVAVTADRPRTYRGTGAPQAIEQATLFGPYAPAAIDAASVEELAARPAIEGPAHINLCFAEPLLGGWDPAFAPAPGREDPPAVPGEPAADVQAEVDRFLRSIRSPLVIVGGLQDEADADRAERFCRRLGAPILAESSSGVRHRPVPSILRSGDVAAQRGFASGLFDSVIRIGDVPSFRVWRDLDLALKVPVLSISRKPFGGLTRGALVRVPAGRPLPLDGGPDVEPAAGVAPLLEWDRRLSCAADRLLRSWPLGEPAVIRRLSETIPAGSFVYLGNSLPIREWTRFATRADRGFAVGGNRGANGIDGQISTFLGWARAGVENWAIVGDLTALYDLSSLWAVRHLRGLRLRIVVINNGGGRIFQRMYQNARFQNRHETGLAGWAAMWGAEYHDALPEGAVGETAVIELRPSEAETDGFWLALGAEEKG